MDFTDELREVISFCRDEAIRLGNNFIGIEHTILAIIKAGVKSIAFQLITNNSVLKGNISELGKSLEELISKRYVNYKEACDNLPFTKSLEKALKAGISEAKLYGDKPDSFHFLLAILKVLNEREYFFKKDPVLSNLLKSYGLTTGNLEKLRPRNLNI